MRIFPRFNAPFHGALREWTMDNVEESVLLYIFYFFLDFLPVFCSRGQQRVNAAAQKCALEKPLNIFPSPFTLSLSAEVGVYLSKFKINTKATP